MKTMSSAEKVATRFLQASSNAFQEDLKRAAKLDGRILRFRPQSLGMSDALYINFINLPEGVGGAGGGAEGENNRMMFKVEGFDKKDPSAPPPSGKVRVEMVLSALPREHKLRAKAGTPEQIAKYLGDFISKIVREVEPKFTHTRP